MRNQVVLLSLMVLGLGVAGCASYQSKVQGFRDSLKRDQPEAAAEKVKEKAWKDGDDQVVYLFEYATAEQLAGNYKESNKAFLLAEDLTDIKDYHSVSRIAGSLLLNQGMVQYKGDNYEKVLINAMLAVNFLMLNNPEDAMVEARKLNDKLYKFRFEGKKNYEQNPFAFYLDALIEEQQRDVDSAYIDFKKTYDLNPHLPYLKEDLIRSAVAAQRVDDAEKWRRMWPEVHPVDFKEVGEVVMIYQQGWGPQKRPNPSFPRIPKLYPLYSGTQRVRLEVENPDGRAAGGSDSASALSESVVSVTDVAIKTLDEDYAGLIAMRAAGIATKAVVADQIAQHNQILGAIAWVGLNAADQADLRQWSSLPSSFQVAKLRLRPGSYRVRAVGLDGGLRPTGEVSPWWNVTITPHKKAWLTWRSLR